MGWKQSKHHRPVFSFPTSKAHWIPLSVSTYKDNMVHILSCSLVLKLEQASGRATTGKVSRTSHCLSPLSVRFTCKQANRAHRGNISRAASRMPYCRVLMNRRIVVLLTLSHQNKEQESAHHWPSVLPACPQDAGVATTPVAAVGANHVFQTAVLCSNTSEGNNHFLK